MNEDPRVMEYLMGAVTREARESTVDASMLRIQAHFEAHGFGWWAAEVPGIAPFIGFVGLSHATFDAHFTPCVEIGWRIAFPFWGSGYATDGARAVLAFAFESLGLSEVVSMTVPNNARSRNVMRKLGMTHAPIDDFEHPRVPDGHPLRHHVLYRISRERWNDVTEPRESVRNAPSS